jgi:hypothetical protein
MRQSQIDIYSKLSLVRLRSAGLTINLKPAVWWYCFKVDRHRSEVYTYDGCMWKLLSLSEKRESKLLYPINIRTISMAHMPLPHPGPRMSAVRIEREKACLNQGSLAVLWCLLGRGSPRRYQQQGISHSCLVQTRNVVSPCGRCISLVLSTLANSNETHSRSNSSSSDPNVRKGRDWQTRITHHWATSIILTDC